jgi:hypothetical protein
MASVALALSSLALGARGWPTARLWFYYLAAASLALVGIQLLVTWVQMEVLRALQARSERVQADMRANNNGYRIESPCSQTSVSSTPVEVSR